MAWQKIVDKKMNQDFRGHAEKCTYEFSLGPEQIPSTGWAKDTIINAHIKSLQEQGSRLLELRVYEDKEPTWQTNYYVEMVATASPLWWNIIIVGALILMIVVAVYFTIVEVEDIAEYLGGKSPISLPLFAIAGIAIAAVVGLALLRKRK